MSKIKPFKAVHYNQEKIDDLSKVVCPPYDVISEEERTAFFEQHPHNFISLLLPKEKEGGAKESCYENAKDIYEQWLKEQILIQDDTPGIYFYKQEYKIQGQRHSRRGFICLMELGDDTEEKVKPHENTHADAVDDRLCLWGTLESNLSCIFVCYSDSQRKIDKIFQEKVLLSKPIIDIEDNINVRHIVWKLGDEDLIKDIQEVVGDQNLFIADGHHRYKVSQQYCRSRMQEDGPSSSDNDSEDKPGYQYLMTYFTNMDSRDLQIFPMHRIVTKLPKPLDFLEQFFRIDKIKTKEDLFILLAKAGKNEHAYGLYQKGSIQLLRLKNKLLIDEHIKEGSKEFKMLDATLLKAFVFDQIGLKSKAITYTNDFQETISKVDNGQAEASFIMNPVKISELKAIALNGERMPPKTTYFYPKVLSGLTIHKMQ